mmetsp:Transcript_22461/g.58651  ORF Transcript_22461/g.58651 Transcript_22461/m.58651 type:complete len:121 (-) Transcript_22461:173-535(-)
MQLLDKLPHPSCEAACSFQAAIRRNNEGHVRSPRKRHNPVFPKFPNRGTSPTATPLTLRKPAYNAKKKAPNSESAAACAEPSGRETETVQHTVSPGPSFQPSLQSMLTTCTSLRRISMDF